MVFAQKPGLSHLQHSSGMFSYLTSTGVESTLEGLILSPVIVTDGCRSFPSGVTKKYVDAKLVNTQVLERAGSQRPQPDEDLRRPVRPVAPTGQIGRARELREDLKPRDREGPRRSSQI